MVKAMKKVLVCAMAAALTLGSAASASAVQSPTTSVTPVTKSNVKASNGTTVNVNKNGTAAVKAVKATKSKSVTVSATVKVNGVTYKVTTVNAKAFAKATKATKITLPASIKTINKSAFTGAKKVKTIVLKGKKSITVKKGAFKGVNTKKVTIKVNKKNVQERVQKTSESFEKGWIQGQSGKSLKKRYGRGFFLFHKPFVIGWNTL